MRSVTKPVVTLILTSGPRAGERIEIVGEVSVGRSGTEILLDDPELSRRHAVLRPDGQGLYVEDLKSLNGTQVNGQILTEPVTAGHGAIIQIGQTTIQVECAPPARALTKLSDGRTKIRPQVRLDTTGVRPIHVAEPDHVAPPPAVTRDGAVPVAPDAAARVTPGAEDGAVRADADARAVAVQVEHLTLSRGGRPVLNEVSLICRTGEVTGLLGPSGAGKTSLIRAIAGVQAGIGDSVRVFGLDPSDPAVRRDLGYVTQAPSVYADLTALENVRYFAAIKQQPYEGLLERVGLAQQRNQLVRDLSGGQRARVSLAAALIGRPRLLLLDEPTVGLDPLLRRELWELFAELAAEGSTLLVSSHVLDEARHCQFLLLMREGRLLAQMTPAELVDRSGTMDMDEAFVRLIGEP
jgi:ABC-2 type transport system ATP-binding protein